MHVTDLAINRALGMSLAPAGEDYLLEVPEAPLLLNHVGTIHASVQFALAEACSGEFLLRQLREPQAQVFAVLRNSEVKFRKPAHGALRASASFVKTESGIELADGLLGPRGRALVSVLVIVRDAHSVTTLSGQFDWFLQRTQHASEA